MCAADRVYRVLIVDDDESVLHFVDRVLRESGYDTAVAPDAEAAIEIARPEASFDLLLTDVNMPEVAGDELARRLRRRQPNLKILYLTGFVDRLFGTRRELSENETFVEKPIMAAGLREAVSFALFGHTRGPE